MGGLITIILSVIFYAIWQFALNAPMGIPSSAATWVFSLIVYFIVCNATQNSVKGGAAEGGTEDVK